MGRGRAKAKQQKVARKLKYSSGGTDLERLRSELGVAEDAETAAAIAGESRCVRAPGPWRPTKLRLLVEAQRSPGGTLSGFIARHIEQPASRHSKPASVKMRSRPSSSA